MPGGAFVENVRAAGSSMMTAAFDAPAEKPASSEMLVIVTALIGAAGVIVTLIVERV